MKITIVGAGAIGTLLGVRLAHSGQEVSFLDKHEQVMEMRAKGITLTTAEEKTLRINRPTVSANASELGVQNLIILAVKAHQLVDVAPQLSPLMDAETTVMTVQNGLPWWYFSRHGGKYAEHRLQSLDPTGVIHSCIDSSRIVGCVAYPAAAVVAPGVVDHVEGNRFTIGELDGLESSRCSKISGTLIDAGFKSYVIEDIRAEIWLKAWGSLSFNSISALTHATMEEICQSTHTRWLAGEMMREAQIVANKLGIEFRHTIEKRINGAEKVGAHKTSMLQDVEQGNTLEIDALVGSVLELAELTNTPVPAIQSIHASCKLLNQILESRGGIAALLAPPEHKRDIRESHFLSVSQAV
ncbi:MAG: 2-dehydropantoate 2-reductase [Halioglobus sp.]